MEAGDVDRAGVNGVRYAEKLETCFRLFVGSSSFRNGQLSGGKCAVAVVFIGLGFIRVRAPLATCAQLFYFTDVKQPHLYLIIWEMHTVFGIAMA